MTRSLWTGATGMTAQQLSLDTISNNLANVNTVGYKKESAQFQTLLYQKIQTKTTDSEGDPKPVIGQVGLGTKVSSVVSQYTQGNLQETNNPFDLAIDGEGFFMVQMPNGSTAYTRNGSFELGIGPQGTTLATADGYPVLDMTGKPIVFDRDIDTSTIEIDEFGNITYKVTSEVQQEPTPDGEGNGNEGGTDTTVPEEKEYQVEIRKLGTIGRAQFNNPAGLEKLSGTLLKETDNSGTARVEAQDSALSNSKILSGYLEGSNVQVANELVDLIVTQRAYQMNSKIITATDEMLQQANTLRN